MPQTSATYNKTYDNSRNHQAANQCLNKTSSFALRPVKRPRLKDYLNKTYALARSVGYEKFLKELGAAGPIIKSAVKLKPMVTLTKEEETYSLKINYGEFDQVHKFKIGEEIASKRSDGREVKSVFEICENKLIEKQESSGREVVIIKRKFTETDLVVTMEVNKVKCQRYYKPVESKHSIGTETSRRRYFIRAEEDYQVQSTPPVNSVIENVSVSESESEKLCL